MYKKYQTKSLLILSVIMILCNSFVVQVDMSKARWWHLLDLSFKIFILIAGCWIVDGYFLTNSFARLSNFLKNFLSILLGVVVLFILGFVIDIIAPKSYLFNNEVGYQTLAFSLFVGKAFK